MKIQVTLSPAEAEAYVEQSLLDQLGKTLTDSVCATIEAPTEETNFSLQTNPVVGQSNKIFLIKMIRCAQHTFSLHPVEGSNCMGLADSKRFVEKYLENPNRTDW